MYIDLDHQSKLAYFQALHEDAKRKHEPILKDLQKWEEQYKGSKKIDETTDSVKYCRNITFELIESQVNSYLPPAQVRPLKSNETNHMLAKTLERYLNNQLDWLPFEKLNDIDERMTYIYGGSVWLIEWDTTIMTHNTIGGYKVTIIDPKQFIPQPGVFDIQDGEYCFIEYTDTHENLVRKYNITFEKAQETSNDDDENADDTCTVIVCFYKDDQDRVCQYIWADEVELSDIDDYWGRKVEKCTKCGKTRQFCTCKDPEFKKTDLDEEEITETMVFCNGQKVISPKTPIFKDGELVFEEKETPLTQNGVPVMQEVAGTVLPITQKTQEPKSKPTKVPFYKPSLFPIVIRKNISTLNSVFGQSDCEYIRDQQQTVNKLESRINEKSINSGVAFTKGRGTKFELSDKIFKDGIEVENQAEKALIDVLDFRVDTKNDEQRSEKVYQQAKRTLGISDSYQGFEDTTAKSGIAKQIQTTQAAGRLESKRIMKNAAYAEIFEIMFQLGLAFADEPRPVNYQDHFGEHKSDEFNRYAFLELDKAGEWYYNDEFMFSTSKVADVQGNREFMWEETRKNYQTGAYGNPQDIDTMIYFWQTMDKLHYPNASITAEMLKEKKAQQIAQAQQQQAAMAQMQPQTRQPQTGGQNGLNKA